MKNNTFKTGVPNFWFRPKILLIMKLIIVIMTTFLIQASASSFAQRITLNEKATSLQIILSKIRMQTGYDFISNNDLIRNSRPYTIQVNNVSLEEALNVLFTNQDLTFEIEDKTVVIKEKKPSLFNRILDAIKAIDIRGKVLDETGKPLPGAVIKVKGTGISLITNNDGEFVIRDINSKTVLQISYIGFRTKEHTISGTESFISITMELIDNKLEEVNILSTGFQKLPKERATGSFELVNNQLLNRTVGTDVFSRLNGVTAGTLFSGNNVPLANQDVSASAVPGVKLSPLNKLQIRGISTLETGTLNLNPLVVLDNFPYTGDVNNINPNDVENITILKDAAAASIWGTKASNGVIVITTKRAGFEHPLRITLNSNVSIAEKPDLFYKRQMSSSDFIDLERKLFDQGVYDNSINDPVFQPVSPVVELLAKQRALPLTDLQGRTNIDNQINAFRSYDVRNDLLKYVYQTKVNQQYALNLTGGSKQISYLFSGGFDKNRESEIQIGYKRINLRSSVTIKPVNNFEIQTDIFYTGNEYKAPSYGTIIQGRTILNLPYEPYTRLADDQGNPLSVNPKNDYVRLKNSYKTTAGNGRLLNWEYKPLNDIGTNSALSKSQNLLMNLGLNYKLNSIFNTSVYYQYGRNVEEATNYESIDSYDMRSYINLYAEYDKTNPNSAAKFNIPLGGRSQSQDIFQTSNSLRGQLNANKTWNKDHEFNGIIGAEVRESKTYSAGSNILYGYYPDPLSSQPVLYNTPFPLLNEPDQYGTETIRQPIGGLQNFISRNTYFFINAAYTYKGMYTLSASARKDAANIFGVKVNRRGQPNWSVGGSYILSNEPFFNIDFFKYLKLRATYGYLGNVNNSISAYPIIQYAPNSNTITNLNYADLISPPNPSLGPERTGMVNFGLDFALKNNILSGSIEFYDKRSKNLIAPTPLDLSTGFNNQSVNSANLKTAGFEVNLTSTNLALRKFQWTTNFLLSFTHNVVTKYLLPKSQDAIDYIPTVTGILPQRIYISGNDPFSLYAYKWAGLDPETGDPMGYDKNGNLSKDYSSLINVKVTDMENLGSVIPLYYGALRNTFNWKSLSLSANILFKFAYHLNPPGIRYSDLITNTPYAYGDYSLRWQKPGDEKFTNVPSFTDGDSQRDIFYQGSSARVISGDHVRLQDIRLGYTFNQKTRYFKSAQIFTMVNNLGIIWKANKSGIDPDTFTNPPAPRTFVMGINVGF